MHKPSVSVVIACYKSNYKHLLDALDSATSQSYPHIEIIVSDDSPDDKLRSVVEHYDTRIKYMHNKPSLGPAINHWRAFEHAQGKYIAILNHDDRLDTFFIEKLKNKLDQNPASALAFCDHWIMDGNGCIQVEKTEINSLYYGRSNLASGTYCPFPSLVLTQTIPMAMGTLFRRSFLPDKLPLNAGPAYDLWLTYHLARTGASAIYVPERLSFWRDHSENTTSGGGVSWLQDSANCWVSISSDPFFADYKQQSKSKACNALLSCSMSSWRNCKPLKALLFSLRSLRMKLSFKALIIILVSFWVPYKVLFPHATKTT